MATTTELMQARFRELCAERDGILAQTQALKDQRAPIQAQIEALTEQSKALTGQIRAIEDPRLSECMDDISAIVKALNGKTGPQS